MRADGVDVGFTHIAIPVTDLDRSISFYRQYADMEVVHRRGTAPGGVSWLSDLTRPFVIVLLGRSEVPHPFSWPAHIGIAVAAREEVDRIAAQARQDGCLRDGPEQRSATVGYITWIDDPDGHTVEFSHGQATAFAVENAQGNDSDA